MRTSTDQLPSESPTARADLHVHSRYSDRPSEWFLRRIGAPESFTEPREVYDRCRAAGMDFVTISDHNCIRGALEIAHLPGAFLSNEVTTYFPEDGCKIHCLVFGISERQFDEIQEVRRDIYAFRDYLISERVLYSVAHPLFSVNDRLSAEHFEKLILLFKRFEGINGARDPRACRLAREVFAGLTPEILASLADRHGIEPAEPEPWAKVLTAGSDDHGGLAVASAFTVTPPARTVEEFLDHLRRYDHTCGGADGTSLDLARGFYSIGYRFYKDRLLTRSGRTDDLLNRLFEQFLAADESATPTARSSTLRRTVRSLLEPKVTIEAFDRQIVLELVGLLRQGATEAVDGETPAEACFRKASALSHKLTTSALSSAIGHLEHGRIVESLQTASSLAPLALCVAPYLAAFQTQHKDRRLLAEVAEAWGRAHLSPPRHLAWFTDTFDEANGVARTVGTFARQAARRGDAMTVFTCLEEDPALANVRNFQPAGRFELEEYRGQILRFPPFLEVLRECERLGVTDLVISTPGPMGAIALAAARIFGLPATGIYHTDFPAYVRSFTDSPALEQLTWSFMRWFFDRMDRLFVPSRTYLDDLERQGFDRRRMRLLPRGVDVEGFNPRFRDRGLWTRFGLEPETLKFLFVGRLSKEKNLDVMLQAFLALRDLGEQCDLVLVGDGPHRQELEHRYAGAGVAFTGTLLGAELAAAFASSDVFVFPSRTDTFGNVVLEAQASGLPVVVSDRSGAHEIVAEEEWGLVVDTSLPGPLAEAMASLARSESTRRAMARRALRHLGSRTEDRWARILWDQIHGAPEVPGVAAAIGIAASA